MRYTKTHDWVKLSGPVASVGISHYAQKELGAIVYVELPKIGSIVEQGEEVAVIESTKAAYDLYAPVTGKIIEVNESLVQSPHLINSSAEDKGWLYKMEVADVEQLGKLISSEEYQKVEVSTAG